MKRFRSTVGLGIVSLIASSLSLVAVGVAATPALAATDPGCTLLGGDDTTIPGTCQVSASVAVSGTITVAENVHLLAGADLNASASGVTLNVDPVAGVANLEMDGGSQVRAPGKAITINVPDGDMTMHNGAVITTTVTSNGGAAGPITIHVGNFPSIPPAGVFVMETGSKVEANGGSSGVGGDIVITSGRSAQIDGQILSQVNTGLSGTGAVQGRDGGSIMVDTGCGLGVGQSGVISSRGRDAGADLVHLSSCEVVIDGLVESTGAGHAIPNNPPNHCDSTFRPGKPSNSTACVEVWAKNITITSTGEINADVNSTGAGGSEGESWVDLFAHTNITITGKTGELDKFSVHADTGSGSDTSPNTITAKAVNGTFTGSGKILSASIIGAANGAFGGDVVVEAGGAVNLATGTVMAAGDNVGGGNTQSPCDVGGSGACGSGGTINVRSFNAGISWINGVGDVNPDESDDGNGPVLAPNPGSIALKACTTVTTTGTFFDDSTPTVTTGVCGGTPPLPSLAGGQYDVVFHLEIWEACEMAFKSGTKFEDNNGNHIRDEGELGLQGWEIHIFNADQSVHDHTTTGVDGSYSFAIPPGSYTVCETLKPGWTQTYPVAGPGIVSCAGHGGGLGYQITLTAGQRDTGNDFGNDPQPLLCPEDPNRAPLITRTVDTSKPPTGINYHTVQAAYNAAASNSKEVIGLYSNTIENVTLNGAKTLTITQCTLAKVTAAVKTLPVWDITSTGKLTIVGPDAVGGTIGFRLVTGGHDVKGLRASGASIAGIQVQSNNNGVAWNSTNTNAIGVQVSGDYNDLRGGTTASNTGTGVQLTSTANNNTLRGATIQSNNGNGVLVDGPTNMVRDNTVSLNKLNGIKVTGTGNTILNNVMETNTQDGLNVSGATNTLEGNKANKNKGDGIEVGAAGNKLKNNESNQGSSAGSKENTGAEFRLTVAATNQGGNKADNIAIPKATAPAKCNAFPAITTCE